MIDDGRLLLLLAAAGLAGATVVRGSRGIARRGAGSGRPLRSPSSPRGDIPLTEIQESETWDAGYEAASKLSRGGNETHLDPDEGFLWAIRNDRRLPYGLKEDDPSFWEYEFAFREGFVAYAKNEGFEIFGGSRGIARPARESAKLDSEEIRIRSAVSVRGIPELVVGIHAQSGHALLFRGSDYKPGIVSGPTLDLGSGDAAFYLLGYEDFPPKEERDRLLLQARTFLRRVEGSRGIARPAREAEPPKRLTRSILDAELGATRRRDVNPGPSARAIQDRLGRHFEHEGQDPKEAAETLKAAMGLLSPKRVLEFANRILGGSRVEYIADAEDDQHGGYGLDYVNMGDTYTATLIFDHRKGRYSASDWGSIVEKNQKRFP